MKRHKKSSTVKPIDFYQLAKKSVTAWVDDYAPSMGAAISYYTVFSIAPLLLIVIAVAGLVWGRDAVQGEIVAQLSGLIGKDGATGIQALIESANKPTQGLVAGAISLVVLVIGATTVFAELQSALDRVWGVPPARKVSGVWIALRGRLLSLGFILGLGFLLSVSLVISAGTAAFGSWTNGLFPGWETLLQVINSVISLSIGATLFAMIFKLMPQATVGWRDVWVGAGVTALLFEIGKTLIGLYIGKSSVTSSFAAAGSLVVLLVWVYYSAQIFLLGAEFTWVYAHEFGSLSHGEKDVAAAAAVASRAAADGDAGADEATARVPQRSRPAPAYGGMPERRPTQDLSASSQRPTLRQRAIVYAATTAAYLAVRQLLKRVSPRRPPTRGMK